MLIRHRGFEPVVDSSAFAAPTAVLAGKVRVGPRARIMYGAVLDSEGSEIEIGECTIICENAVLRATASGDREYPVSVGDHAFIGPHATLLGCSVEPSAYIATGTTVLQGAKIRSGSIVAVGALVHANTVIPKGFFVPPNAVAIGDPVKIYHPGDTGLAAAVKSVGFAKIAFGIDAAQEPPVARLAHIAEVRSKEFEAHSGDTIIG